MTAALIRAILGTAAALAVALPARPQSRDNEKHRIELTTSAWLVGLGGSTASDAPLSGGTSIRVDVDLERDLGFGERDRRFFGRLAVKPARRHRLLIEGVPLRFSAEAVPPRTIAIGGRFFPIRSVRTNVEASYLFGGYQYDLISRRRGHFGLGAGVARLEGNISTTLTEPRDFFESRSGFVNESLPLPLAGAEFRAYPKDWLSVGGDVKGISAAQRGHFLEGSVRVGVGIGCCLILEAGYGWIDGEVITRGRVSQVAPFLRGPVFGIVLLDR